jgi:hypothetical protein
MLWVELHRRCQAQCLHCYNDSGPRAPRPIMTTADWRRVLDQAAELGIGMVQFIGGEPTLHPDLPDLIDHARDRGLQVEIYTNLMHISEPLWESFGRGVRLATSWYTDDPAEHRRITGRPGHARILANIAEAQVRSIPLRVGIVEILDRQRVAQGRAMLQDVGVPPAQISTDRVRLLGRMRPGIADVSQLCGWCGRGCAAVLDDGAMVPCPLGRWLRAGTVHETRLGALLNAVSELAVERVPAAARCSPHDGCGPPCEPQCNPGTGPSMDRHDRLGGQTWDRGSR